VRAGLRPQTVVEIGCGDGALLEALGHRALGSALDGFELSAPAAEIARHRPIPRARRIEPFDGTRVPAGDGAYDLAVLSHVLEHVPEPAPLLQEAARVAEWVLVEVPLEANRSARRPAKRAEALRIGHLHAFDRAAMPRPARRRRAAAGRRPQRSAPLRPPRVLRRRRRRAGPGRAEGRDPPGGVAARAAGRRIGLHAALRRPRPPRALSAGCHIADPPFVSGP
jgi:SAM-dependent methyltransferase